jgi:hypothetical protein
VSCRLCVGRAAKGLVVVPTVGSVEEKLPVLLLFGDAPSLHEASPSSRSGSAPIA